jgi:nitroreductase
VETWQAINTVRVVREFDGRHLEPSHVERILNAGRRAGSSKNQQHWAFITLTDREHLGELAAVGRYAGHLAGASVAIALVTPEPASPSVMWDCGRAAQNMVLAAWELGIGSVPATVYDHELVHRLLGLPEDRRCDFLLSFGYPADLSVLTAPNRAGGRRSLSDVAHEERWPRR